MSSHRSTSRSRRGPAAALAMFALTLGACEPQGTPSQGAEANAQASNAKPKANPFADVTLDPSTRAKKKSPFDGSLAERSVWKRALALAETGQVHFDAAQKAHRDGDRAKLNEEGAEARRLFDQALEDTAVFEEELIVKHGEEDPTVAGILKIRNTWFDRTRWLHKTIAR